MSAAILLTPLMLASATTTFDVPASQYNHLDQTQAGLQKTLVQYTASTAYCFQTSTFNGTQTFDGGGRPFDADADQDHNGDC